VIRANPKIGGQFLGAKRTDSTNFTKVLRFIKIELLVKTPQRYNIKKCGGNIFSGTAAFLTFP
jgi:hypothetical protein